MRAGRPTIAWALFTLAVACSGPTATLSPRITPRPGPSPAPADVFVGLSAGGIEEFSPNGAVLSTFATGVIPLDIAMDDAGGVYAVGAQDGTLQRFAIGGSAANGAFTNGGAAPFEAVEVTPQGAVIAFGENLLDITVLAGIYEWQPDVTGAATQSLDYSAPLNEAFAGLPAVGPGGTLYVAHAVFGAQLGVPAGTAYDVLAPGTNALEREITDTHGASLRPYCMAAGADGTLYPATNVVLFDGSRATGSANPP